jgi:hypothetical protein
MYAEVKNLFRSRDGRWSDEAPLVLALPGVVRDLLAEALFGGFFLGTSFPWGVDLLGLSCAAEFERR